MIQYKEPAREAPCKMACPAGIDVPRYVQLIAEGKFDDAEKSESFEMAAQEVQATVRKYNGVRRTFVRPSDIEMRRNAEIGLFSSSSNFN